MAAMISRAITLFSALILLGAPAFSQSQPESDWDEIYYEGQTGRPAFSPAPDIQEVRSVSEILGAGGFSTVLALTDDVPTSAKRPVTVHYGASLYEPRIGPIAVTGAHLLPYADSVVFGMEAIERPFAADGFLLSFPDHAELINDFGFVIKRRSGKVAAYTSNMSAEELGAKLSARVLALSQVDPVLSAAQAGEMSVTPVSLENGQIFFPIKIEPEDPAVSAHLVFTGVELDGAPLVVEYAGFVRQAPPSGRISVRLEGVVSTTAPPLVITREDGKTITVHPDSSGGFVFPRPEGTVFSATFETPETVNYFDSGRWLSSMQALDGGVVTMRPDFVNQGGQTNDLSAWQRSIKRSRIASVYDGSAGAHTRAWWAGAANKMSRFRGEYFRNNIGFHDIDIVPQRTDGCVVGVYLGESVIEAIQMRLLDKNTTILSEVLSLALQRCVIVHAIAPGNSIQSYANLKRLHQDIDVRFSIFEMNASMFLYMTPEMQQAFFGYAPGFTPVGAFDLIDDGELSYQPPRADWISESVTPSPLLPSGGALLTAFYLAENDAPPEANKAWSLLTKLLDRYAADFPGTLHAVEAIYERARCGDKEDCDSKTMPSFYGARTVSGGTPVFEDRFTSACKAPRSVCVLADSDAEPMVFRRKKLFENDFHYTRRANVWHARQLGHKLAEPLSSHLDEP